MRLLHVSLMIFEPPPFFVIIAMAVVAVPIAIWLICHWLT